MQISKMYHKFWIGAKNFWNKLRMSGRTFLAKTCPLWLFLLNAGSGIGSKRIIWGVNIEDNSPQIIANNCEFWKLFKSKISTELVKNGYLLLILATFWSRIGAVDGQIVFQNKIHLFFKGMWKWNLQL